MSEIYTFAKAWGNKILYRGWKNGIQVIEKVDSFKPKYYIRGDGGSKKWMSLYGEQLKEVSFGDIKDAKEWAGTYDGVEGFDIHGDIEFHYQYLAHRFPNDVDVDINQMSVMVFDIETIDLQGNSNKFPDIQSANHDIVLISAHDKFSNKTVVFGWKEVTNKNSAFEYRMFNSERAMLIAFITFWQQSGYPDIISGWNISTFDVPYLLNRIIRELGEDWAKKLSPFGIITEKNVIIRGKEVQTYDIVGVVELDYYDLYKKFTYGQKESYKLGDICQEELGETKVENPGKNFRDFYDNFYNTFVEYNARDSHLVHKLDNKMKLIELAISVAYLAKSNIRDALGVVKMWDVFIYNHLLKKNIAVPPQKRKLGGEFEGAYVKDVKPGMYGWVMTFDFASLYPTIMRQWNISPEQIINDKLSISVDDIVFERFAKDLVRSDCTLAANGTMYRKNQTGVIPEVAALMVVGRKVAKKKMLELEKEYQLNHDESLVGQISALNNRQMALKIAANALYGAVTNIGFRYFDLRMGEAITLTGQASNRHLERSLNDYMNKILGTVGVEYAFYGDTDSNFLNVQPLVDKFCKGMSVEKITKFLDRFGERDIQKVINDSINKVFDMTNGYDLLMGSKREAISSKSIFISKKRYAMKVHNSEGVDYSPYKLKIMGLDIIKTSTPHWVRGKLKETLSIIFDQNEAALISFVKKTKEEFRQVPIETVAFPKSVNDIDKWVDGSSYKKGTPIHVRASVLYNSIPGNAGTIRSGDKIRFVYLTSPNPIRENIIGFPIDGKVPPSLLQYVDSELQWEKTFISPLAGIVNVIGWNLEEKSSLSSFFS